MQSMRPTHAAELSLDDDDHFDRLPDSLVLVIFNKFADVRSLGRCLAVSKRFNGLVPLVHDVVLKIGWPVTVDGEGSDKESLNIMSSIEPRRIHSHLFVLMFTPIIKPFRYLQHAFDGHSPPQILKNFTHIRNLKIELPARDFGTEDGEVLKWRAEYGRTLQSCLILAGTRMELEPAAFPNQYGAQQEDNWSFPASLDNSSFPASFDNWSSGLKLRVLWAFSSLIAASSRHYNLRQIIMDHPTLRSLVVTDADGQGTLAMGVDQLRDYRDGPLVASTLANRTRMPVSKMKLRYEPCLELSGFRMQGATLMSIEPAVEGNDGRSASVDEDDEALVSGAFDGPFEHAAKTLVKRATYPITIDSI